MNFAAWNFFNFYDRSINIKKKNVPVCKPETLLNKVGTQETMKMSCMNGLHYISALSQSAGQSAAP